MLGESVLLPVHAVRLGLREVRQRENCGLYVTTMTSHLFKMDRHLFEVDGRLGLMFQNEFDRSLDLLVVHCILTL